jgi:hypothetical protein
LALIVAIGSLLAIALWEFCRPRRQREFPALRRRLGNLGIWLLNLCPRRPDVCTSRYIPATVRSDARDCFALLADRKPVGELCGGVSAARFLALRRASLSACRPVALAVSRAASLRSRCRCHHFGAPSSDRVFDRRRLVLASGADVRHPCVCIDDACPGRVWCGPPLRTGIFVFPRGWSARCNRW